MSHSLLNDPSTGTLAALVATDHGAACGDPFYTAAGFTYDNTPGATAMQAVDDTGLLTWGATAANTALTASLTGYLTAYPPADMQVLTAQLANADRLGVRLDSTGHLGFYDETATLLHALTATVPLSTWWRLDLVLDAGTTPTWSMTLSPGAALVPIEHASGSHTDAGHNMGLLLVGQQDTTAAATWWVGTVWAAFGAATPGADSISLWSPDEDAPAGVGLFAWGYAGQRSTGDRVFRVHNNSLDHTATGITVSLADTGATVPSVAAQHLLSADGLSFTASIAVPDLPPQATSPPLYLRRVTASTAPLGADSFQVVVTPAGWT